jgi:tetratricopeptide (TPR) repeat protein
MFIATRALAAMVAVVLALPRAEAESVVAVPRILLRVQRVSWGADEDIRGGLLTRELVRQAVLMAARDELGLHTADAVLGESLPAEPAKGSATLAIRVETPAANRLRVTLELADVQPPQQLLTKEYTYNQDARYIYQSLARVLEPEIRGAFANAIQAALTSSATPPKGDGAAPNMDRIDKLQSEMNFASQFTAVRLAHAELRRAPESPDPLGALARGYAHLALLTWQHRNAAPLAFAARSLLYAQRQCGPANESPTARANRIYARAVVGLHDLALRENAELEKELAGGAALDPAAAARLAVAQAYCRFDRPALERAQSQYPQLAQLAAVLRARAADGVGDERLLLEATGAALDVAPEAYCLYPPLEYRGTYNVARTAASGALRRIHVGLLNRLAAIDEVPVAVRGLAANAPATDRDEDDEHDAANFARLFPPVLRELADALAAAASADAGEPSWAALAGIIREELFVNSAWYVEITGGGYSRHNAVAAIRPLIAGHRYEGYIASFAFDRESQADEFHKSLRPIDMVDLRATMRRMYLRLWEVSFPNRERIGDHSYSAVIRQRSFTADEMALVIRQAEPGLNNNSVVKREWPMLLGQIPKISPHHPMALRATITNAKAPAAEQLAAWEQAVQLDPRTLCTLGRKYHELKQYDAAIRCFEQAISLSPSREAFEGLADAHRGAGREDLWLASLERYLQTEDTSLGHAAVRNRIAQTLLYGGQAAEAAPYARAAAETGAAWALVTASEVFERLENWEASEHYVRSVSERYAGGDRVRWYLWCRRTGHGMIDEANRLAKEFYDANRHGSDYYDLQAVMVYEVLTAQNRDSLKTAQSLPKDDDAPYWGPAHAALMAKQLNKPNSAATALKVIGGLVSPPGDKPGELPPETAALEILLGQLTEDDPAPPTVEQLDAALEPLDISARAEMAYFVGRACELAGATDAAVHCYRRAVDKGPWRMFNVTLAAFRLQAIEAKAN